MNSVEKEPIFKFKIKVRDYECDAQGIVNNANYLHYYELTRHEFFEKCGLEFQKLHDEGFDPVVSQVTVKYKDSLKGGDEFYCTVDLEKKGIRYVFIQKITRIPDGVICSEASTDVVVLFNGKLYKPQIFDVAFAEYI